MDALMLARMQFAANITFHILFPTISIALGLGAAVLPLALAETRDGRQVHAQGWLDAYRFWTKVFALTFALGVVSGITMSFQFGTNWPGFMETVGNIAGPLLGLRGADRVLPRGRLPGRDAVRPRPGQRAGALRWRPSSSPSAPRCRRSGSWR